MLNYKEVYDRLSEGLSFEQKQELLELLQGHLKLEMAFEEACLNLEKLTYVENMMAKNKKYVPWKTRLLNHD